MISRIVKLLAIPIAIYANESIANDTADFDVELVSVISKHINPEEELLNVEKISVGERDLIYFVTSTSTNNVFEYQYHDIKENKLLNKNQYDNLRKLTLDSYSKVVIVDTKLQDKLDIAKPNDIFTISVSLRRVRNFNQVEDESKRRSVETKKKKNSSSFEIVEILGESEPNINSDKFLSKVKKFRQKYIDRILKIKWDLESTKLKLTTDESKRNLLNSGRSIVELTKLEIQDAISNGKKVISSVGLLGEIEESGAIVLERINMLP